MQHFVPFGHSDNLSSNLILPLQKGVSAEFVQQHISSGFVSLGGDAQCPQCKDRLPRLTLLIKDYKKMFHFFYFISFGGTQHVNLFIKP